MHICIGLRILSLVTLTLILKTVSGDNTVVKTLTDCGQNYSSCLFLEPSRCLQSSSVPCQFGAIISRLNQTDQFGISLFTTLSVQYVAIGFNQEEQMDEANVVACIALPNKTAKLGRFKAQGYGLVKSEESAGNLVKYSVEDGDYLGCRFSLTLKPNEDKFLLLAVGSVDKESFPLKHQRKKLKSVENMVLGFYPDNRLSDDINIGVKTIVLKQSISSENATVGLEPNFERSMLQTHALSMLIGWWIFVPMAIVLARYFKEVWVSDCCGVRTWFGFHQGFNITGVLLISLGIACIFGVRNGIWLGDEPSVQSHAVCGLTASVIGLFQPLFAVFRCGPQSKSRFIFNVIHRCLGLSCWCIAAATIFLALGLIETPHKKILRILMITYFVTVAFLIFFLELLQGREDRMEEVRVVKKRSNNNDLPMRSTRSRNGGGDPLSFEEEPEEFTYRLPTSRWPKNFIYGLFLPGLVGLVVAICYLVAMSDFGS